MMSWKVSLLFFSAVTLHGCLSGTAEPEDQDASYITKILTVYNQRKGVTYLYKYLDQHAATPPQGEENNRGFFIKETDCLKSENPDLSQCDFKPDGDVKICDLVAEVPEDIMCISLPERSRVRRSRSNGRDRRNCNGFRNRGNNRCSNQRNNRGRPRPPPGFLSPIGKFDIIRNI